MGKVIYSSVYVFNPKNDVVIEIEGEDYRNLIEGNSRMINHPIKFIGIEKDSRLREKLDELGQEGSNPFVSTPWGFFVKTPKGERRIGISREREQEIYDGLRDCFVTANFAVYEANKGIDGMLRR